jgi:hypothetical protein
MSKNRQDHLYNPGFEPLLPFGYWPADYDEQSRREGWILTNDSSDCISICRLDDPAACDHCEFNYPLFGSDMAAREYVIAMAMQGHCLHALALYLQGHRVDHYLNMDVPNSLLPQPLATQKQRARLRAQGKCD